MKDFRYRLQCIIFFMFALYCLGPYANAQTVQRYTDNNGYVKPWSVAKGDTLNIYINTSKPKFDIIVYRIGLNEFEPVMTITGVTGGSRTIDTMDYEKGVSWPVSYRLKIPEDWRTGAYGLDFPDAAGQPSKGAVFAVKEKVPGSSSRLLLLFNDFNWTAYNLWGGKNVYPDGSTWNTKADRVSLNRPFSQHRGMGEFHAWTLPMIKWLEKNNIKYELASTMDVHKDPKFLDNYDVLIVAGHDEYYSRPERMNMERFINRGGRHISLSGNTCWWQVRMEDNDNTMVCYKSNTRDPLVGKADSLVTTNWYMPPLNYPETIFLGATFLNAGYVNDIHHYLINWAHGYGDYGVWNSQHWIYNNTGLKDGDEFGRLPNDSSTAIVGYEVDAALFQYRDGIPVVTGTDMTPTNYRILGTSPCEAASYTKGLPVTMGLMVNPKGGAVFNSASINWTLGLEKDPMVHKIFSNILTKFMRGGFPPEIVSWKPFVLVKDTVNGELLDVNRRDISLNSKDTIRLSLKVFDPYGEKVNYVWYVDSIKRGTDSTFSFIGTGGGSFKVKVLVYNSKDTSSLVWNMNVNGPTSIVQTGRSAPDHYFLEQNYPNPFNPETRVKYGLANDGRVTIELFNIVGQKLSTLVDEYKKAGNYELSFNGRNLPSGVYLYRISTEGFMQVRKMVLMK
ncbi:MAG: N,N-dimethylformamidase beta subunit family domain-containing protein [Ignavibacteriales bacterium]